MTSGRNERMKILVDSCVREMDKIGMRMSRMSGVAGPPEEERHAVSKFRRAVRMKIAIKDSKRTNIATKRGILKTVS